MAERTRRLNSIRGLLREFGIVIAVGATKVVPAAWAAIEDADAEIPDALRPVLAEACQEVRQIEERIRIAERQLEALAKQIPTVALLRTIPGIGLLTATALVAWIGDAKRFPLGKAPEQLCRAHPARVLQWPQALPRSHLQAWRRLPQVTPHPGSSLLPHPRTPVQGRSSRRLGTQTQPLPPPQQGRSCGGQQAGPRHLGRLGQRKALRQAPSSRRLRSLQRTRHGTAFAAA